MTVLRLTISDADLTELVSQFQAGWLAQAEFEAAAKTESAGARTEAGLLSVLNTLGVEVLS